MPSFGLIGAAGFVAPRHMQAIKAIGGEIKAAFDPHDSVGAIDEYFPDALLRRIRALRAPPRRAAAPGRKARLDLRLFAELSSRGALPLFAPRRRRRHLRRSPWFSTPGILHLALPRSKRRRAGAIPPCCSFGFTRRSRRMKAGLAARAGRPLNEGFPTYVASRGRWDHTSWKGKEEMIGWRGHQYRSSISSTPSCRSSGSPTASIVHSGGTPGRAAGFLTCDGAAICWFVSIVPERSLRLPRRADRHFAPSPSTARRSTSRTGLRRSSHPKLRGDHGRARIWSGGGAAGHRARRLLPSGAPKSQPHRGRAASVGRPSFFLPKGRDPAADRPVDQASEARCPISGRDDPCVFPGSAFDQKLLDVDEAVRIGEGTVVLALLPRIAGFRIGRGCSLGPERHGRARHAAIGDGARSRITSRSTKECTRSRTASSADRPVYSPT